MKHNDENNESIPTCVRWCKYVEMSEKIQSYRDRLAKEIRTSRLVKSLNGVQIDIPDEVVDQTINVLKMCASMLDLEKSVKVAETVQAIKEYRKTKK